MKKLTIQQKKFVTEYIKSLNGELSAKNAGYKSKDLKDTFIIRRGGTEIIIQEGKLLNREILSSGTAEGIETIRAANIKKKGT